MQVVDRSCHYALLEKNQVVNRAVAQFAATVLSLDPQTSSVDYTASESCHNWRSHKRQAIYEPFAGIQTLAQSDF